MVASRVGWLVALALVSVGARAAVYPVATPAELTAAVEASNLSPEADTIVLLGDIELTTSIDNGGRFNGVPPIAGTLTIDGTGHEIRRAPAAAAFTFARIQSGANVVLRDLTVRGFIANSGSGSFSDGSRGGALYSSGTLRIEDCHFIANQSHEGSFPADGGAIFNSGSLTVESSTFSGNVAASRGAAIYHESGALSVVNSTFSGNHSEVFGSAMMLFAPAQLRHVTIVGNTAPVNNFGAIATSGALEVYNSLVAGNSSGACRGQPTAGAGNIADVAGCGAAFVTVSPAELPLGPLQDNGGPTPTHALPADNAAADAGAGLYCLDVDQRGEVRCDGACDAGAFERMQATLQQAITGVSATPSPGVYGGFSQLAFNPGPANQPVTVQSTTPAVCEAGDGLVVYLGTGTCRVTLDQRCDARYLPAPQVQVEVPVLPAAQAISQLAATPAMGSVGDVVVLSAQGGGSGQPVTFDSQTPSTCSVAGTQATLTGAGVCRIGATQAGDANHLAATPTSLLIPVARLAQSIVNFEASSPAAAVGESLTLSADGGASGLPVSFDSRTPSRCIVEGTTVTMIAVGDCEVEARQAGDANHEPAAPVTLALTVTPAAQAIAQFAATPNPAGVGALVLLWAQGGASGEPVQFASLTPATCAVLGNVAQLLAIGTCTIGATQSGNANYLPAPAQTLDIDVQGASIFADDFE